MGLIALHAAHRGGPLPVVLQSACAWSDAAAEGEPVDLAAAAPRHPIAQGLQRFRIARGAAHSGAFDAPRPDVVVFDGSLPSGDRVWQGMVWTRGRGRIFYFQPGHPDYPVYLQEEVRQVLHNAVRWCAHRSAPVSNA
jgi:trehalose utilization protein